MLVTVDTFRTFLDREGLSGYEGWTDSEITQALTGAEGWLGRVTGREWTATSATRLFTGNGSSYLELPEFQSVSAVTISGVAVSSSDYQVLPLNSTPKRQLYRPNGSWTCPSDGRFGNISVTAIWGYCAAAALPHDVTRAVCLMAAVQGQTGGIVPNPTLRVTRLSAFSLSFGLRNAGDSKQVLSAIESVARSLVQPFVDHTARYARLIGGTG